MPTKQQLKQRLREKLQARRLGRTSNLTLKLQTEKSTDIYDSTERLMRDTAILSTKVTNPVKRALMLKGQHTWLHDNHFAIFKATVYGEMSLGMLRYMLNQKQKIDRQEMSAKDVSLQVGDKLAKKYNVDVEALEKHAIKTMREQGKEIPKEYQGKY